ncbi:MAG: DNA repair protein RecN [Betaproteobacteria bacterium]
MLRSLSIRDFVIVDRMDLEFDSGFTVLSGETGAGKSILVDALALLLGERGDALVVRQGAERADLTAAFDLQDAPECARWLGENALAEDEGGYLVRRAIDASGRSRAFINGRAATLAQLKAAGEFLVDIHGQHQHQSLQRASAQRDLLDAYGGLTEVSAQVRAAYREWQRQRERRVAAEANAAASAAEREQLERQVREIEALDLTAEEWRALIAEHARLAHATNLIETAQLAVEALAEAEGSSLARLNLVMSRLENVLEYDARLKPVLETLEPARIQLQEACSALRHYADRLETDPQRQHQVEQRIEAVHGAARKYRVTPEALPEVLARARQRLSEMAEGADAQQLRRLEEEARKNYVTVAKKLSAARKRAAGKLSDAVTQAMQKLAMAGGVLEIALEPLESPAAHGLEEVSLRVSAHKGMPPQPLARVASGGELSRISLAIQTVTSGVAQMPTLIFDEVDAGIGGRVAEMVGRMLRALGKRHQVMSITHLPQVAASADHQWRVSKATDNGRVSSSVTVLDGAQRVEEIARMLGGLKITETTRRHAAEMLGVKS